MTSFNIEQKRVDVFASAAPDRPVIYLNTYGREGKQVLKHLQETGCPDFQSNSAGGGKSIAGYPFLAGDRGIFTGRTVCGLFDLSDRHFFTGCQYVRFPVVSGNQRLHRFPHAFEKAGLYVLFAG